MSKPQIVEDKDLDRLIKVTRVTSGPNALRNVALIYTLFGTGLMPTEIADLKVGDYLDNNNEPRKETEVRTEISFNGRSRPLMWVNKKLVAAIDAYLEERATKELDGCVGELDPCSPLFLAKSGEGFSYRVTERNGKTYRACASLTNLLNKLMAGAGLEGCNTSSARRTLAVKLHRKHVDLRTINEILGQSSLTATKALVQGDTRRLSDLVAGVI
ncbi:MAG: site-specific integrase [Gammaproteobacteria bacterium]|nr:site-specific integrase [Gammaproteobacteria bacterium]